ncbi:hypothetical protein BBJ28_00024111, partial [Nothophytophthora sp. Chile5]
MIGKPTARGGGARTLDTQSLASLSSVRTVDRERLRDKARQLQMKESLRLAMCARLQQQLRKTPKVAEEMASEVLRVLAQRGLPSAELSDTALADIVHELTTRRQEQLSLAADTARKAAHQSPQQLDPSGSAANLRIPQERTSGRRSSKSNERSSNNSGRQLKGGSRGRGASVAGTSRVGGADETYLTEAQLQQKSTGFYMPPRVSPKKERDNGIWEEIVKFSSVEEQLEAQRLKERKLRERREFKATLEDQVKQKRHATQQEREHSAEYHRQTLERLREAEDEERRKEQGRLEREQDLIVIQTQQRLTKQQQLERQRAVKKAQEQQAAEMLRLQKQADVAREQTRKEAEKRRVAQVLLENEAQLERKRLQQMLERELEVKLAGDYIAMEQRKDEARKQQLATMAENIQKKMKIFDDTAKATTAVKEREEDER